METSHRTPAPQSAPCCLLCNRPLEVVEGADYSEDTERALVCDQHRTIPIASAHSDTYVASDKYVRWIAEISAHLRGHSVQAAWYTTQWFSLLLELSSRGLLLIYPISRRATIGYIPRDICAPDAPKGLLPLRAERLMEISGRWDQGKPKPGLHVVVAAMQLGLPIENIRWAGAEPRDNYIEISFAGQYKLQIIGMGWGTSGWGDLGWDREADDLALRWVNGREPQLIAMC